MNEVLKTIAAKYKDDIVHTASELIQRNSQSLHEGEVAAYVQEKMKELASVTPDQWGGFVLVLAGILATIVLISSAIKAVREMTKPQEELKKEVKRHAECLDRDNKRIAEQEEMTRLTLRGVNALLNHEITGNGIENLKKVRDDITEHLIDK